MSCCNHRCNQGRACRSRRSLVRTARMVLSYAIVLLALLAITSGAFISLHQIIPFTITEITP